MTSFVRFLYMSDTACLCECPYMEVCVRGSLRENLNIEAHSLAQV